MSGKNLTANAPKKSGSSSNPTNSNAMSVLQALPTGSWKTNSSSAKTGIFEN